MLGAHAGVHQSPDFRHLFIVLHKDELAPHPSLRQYSSRLEMSEVRQGK